MYGIRPAQRALQAKLPTATTSRTAFIYIAYTSTYKYTYFYSWGSKKYIYTAMLQVKIHTNMDVECIFTFALFYMYAGIFNENLHTRISINTHKKSKTCRTRCCFFFLQTCKFDQSAIWNMTIPNPGAEKICVTFGAFVIFCSPNLRNGENFPSGRAELIMIFVPSLLDPTVYRYTYACIKI